VFISASSGCFREQRFEDACRHIVDLEYDRIDIWLDENSDHLKPSEVVADPEAFVLRYREVSRLTPVAFTLNHDVAPDIIKGICKAAQLLRVTQVTVPASPLGTPFNSEIDRLREFVGIASEAGIRLSIHTKNGTVTEDPQTAVELCQSVRGLGLTIDPSYYLCGPHRNQSCDPLYPYVFHALLRDSTENEVQVPVGLGEVDYARLISQLERENYTRSLSVDFYPSMMDEQTRPLEMRKIRLLLETLV
jgi:sugar phosphate isomerase/epimerase